MVAVRQGVSHFVRGLERDFGMLGDEGRKVSADISTRFADDFDIADHGVLHQFVSAEGCFVQPVCIARDSSDRRYNVIDVFA
jgi:hypothetical protein